MCESGKRTASTDLPTERARPEAPPMPGADAARTKMVAHTKAPRAEPTANQVAASFSRGENEFIVICGVGRDGFR